MDLEPARSDTPMPTLEPTEGECVSSNSPDVISPEVIRNLDETRKISFSLGRYGSVNDLRLSEFFKDSHPPLSLMVIEISKETTSFTAVETSLTAEWTNTSEKMGKYA